MTDTATENRADETPSAEKRPRRPRRRGRKVAVGVVVLVLAGAATAAVLGLDLWPGSRSREDAAVQLPPNTTDVARGTLTDTYSADGELAYGPTSALTARLPGTLTWVPDVDEHITRGESLYRVDDEPVTAMYGSIPVYRAMSSGDEGKDVRQLERNLKALGYTGFSVDREYTDATAEAVEEWQEDRGLDETGVAEAGQVVFVPQAIRVDALTAAEGDQAQPGKDVYSYTATDKSVTVELDTADQRLATKGADVTVTLPDGDTVDGRIDEVSTVIQPGEGGEDAETMVEVVVALTGKKAQRAADPYALAAVDVDFTAEERKDVLSVPVAALVALQEGGFGVEVVEGRTTSYVPVRTGMFADGRVEIEGDGIDEGTTVGMPK